MKKMFTFIAILSILLSFLTGCKQSKRQFITIGTGGVTGVYYPTGGAISRMLNKKNDIYGIKATVESTGGSTYNINAVMSGDLDFGIAQSDRQYQAFHGQSEWEETGAQTELRSVFSIHPESITLVASEKSGINSIRDLVDKRVNIGNPGSGQLQNAIEIMGIFGITEDMLGSAEKVKAMEAPGLLQDGRIDAFFYTVGHPNGNIKEATSGRIKVSLISIYGPEIDKLINSRPYYAKSMILKSFYENALNTEDIQTIGVKATLVTSSAVPKEVVYALTKEVFENFDEFKSLHPAYAVLTKESMLTGLSAPIHKGALKYYKEAGLDKLIKPELLK